MISHLPNVTPPRFDIFWKSFSNYSCNSGELYSSIVFISSIIIRKLYKYIPQVTEIDCKKLNPGCDILFTPGISHEKANPPGPPMENGRIGLSRYLYLSMTLWTDPVAFGRDVSAYGYAIDIPFIINVCLMTPKHLNNSVKSTIRAY